MISVNSLIEKFRYALNNKWGYIWGTAGEKWTAAKQKELEKTTDGDRAQGRAYGSKWIGHTVADCSGLFSWAFKQLGGYMYHGSDTMYRKYCNYKGELKKGKRTDGATLKPGTAVFVWNGKKYSHVGLYVGGETVIEAMGTQNGVTTSKVTAGKWTHWGELAGVEYAEKGPSGTNGAAAGPSGTVLPDSTSRTVEEPSLPDPFSPGATNLPDSASRTVEEPSLPIPGPTLRKGSKGQAVRELQTMLDKLGYDLGPCGIDGDFGRATEAAVRSFQSDHRLAVDGVVGVLTWAELTAAAGEILRQAQDDTKSRDDDGAGGTREYRVIISGLDLTQAQAIVGNYPGNSTIEKGEPPRAASG